MNNRIYLDNCCFNRPYDDQSYLTIKLESEAKLFVQKEILEGTFELVWSFILDYENAMNPYNDRKQAIQKWRSIAKLEINNSDELFDLAKEFMSSGFKNNDALHMASAVTANCDFFLTTDKGILNKQVDGPIIINPIDFVRALEA
ncbi:MAG: PIN domain protein [Candidatus Adiutrix sp.]|jgi:hypothetical protein|nr:PIN domain protein [Candidatus Adiutrix sp.]